MKIIVSCGENFYENHSQENIDFITLYGYEAKFFNGLIYTLFTKRMLTYSWNLSGIMPSVHLHGLKEKTRVQNLKKNVNWWVRNETHFLFKGTIIFWRLHYITQKNKIYLRIILTWVQTLWNPESEIVVLLIHGIFAFRRVNCDPLLLTLSAGLWKFLLHGSS